MTNLPFQAARIERGSAVPSTFLCGKEVKGMLFSRAHPPLGQVIGIVGD